MQEFEYSVSGGCERILAQAAKKQVMGKASFLARLYAEICMWMALSFRGGEGAAAMIARQVEKGQDVQAYEDVAERLRLLSLPARLRIVDMLRHREECVCVLQEALGRPQPYVSQQLRVLRKAGIIERHPGKEDRANTSR